MQLSIPTWDPDRAAEAAGIVLSYWDFEPNLLGLYVRYRDRVGICLNRQLLGGRQEPLRRVVLAHELGHHAHMHSGVQVAPLSCGEDRLAHGRSEAQAERWAGEQLCPRAFVLAFLKQHDRIGRDEIVELAELLALPFDFAEWWLSDLVTRELLPGTRINHPPIWQPRAGVLAELADL